MGQIKYKSLGENKEQSEETTLQRGEKKPFISTNNHQKNLVRAREKNQNTTSNTHRTI